MHDFQKYNSYIAANRAYLSILLFAIAFLKRFKREYYYYKYYIYIRSNKCGMKPLYNISYANNEELKLAYKEEKEIIYLEVNVLEQY